MSFNVAHTAGLVGVAVTTVGALGLDLEPVRRRVPSALARRWPPNAGAEDGSSDAVSTSAFWERWTLAESYLKARGVGLTVPLDQVDFDPSTGPIRLRRGDAGDVDPARWWFAQWRPTPDHVAALCVERAGPSPPVVVVHDAVPLGEHRRVSPQFERTS